MIRQDDFQFHETPNSAWAWELNELIKTGELIKAGELIIYRSENGTHCTYVFTDWSAEEQAEAWLTPGYTDPLAMGSSIHERLYSERRPGRPSCGGLLVRTDRYKKRAP